MGDGTTQRSVPIKSGYEHCMNSSIYIVKNSQPRPLLTLNESKGQTKNGRCSRFSCFATAKLYSFHQWRTTKRRNRRSMAMNNAGRRKLKRTFIDHNNKPPWSDLMHELLEMIKKRLLFIDRMNFRAVCKSWNCIQKVPPLQQMPWLLVFDYDDDANSSCKLVDSSNKKTYMVNATAITDKLQMTKRSPFLHVHESKFGWLLVSSTSSYSMSFTTTALFLYSPFLGEKINLIDSPILSSRVSLATFTSNPLDDEDCTILTLHTNDSDNTVHINTYRRGESSWKSLVFKCECLQMKVVRWMYSEGIFYYVTKNGVVGKFDFVREEWNVFPSLPTTMHIVPRLHYHMVKSDGELFLILEYNLNKPRIRSWYYFAHHIYRLDLSSMIWEDLSSIGDRVLFIGDGYNSVLNASVMKFNGERKGISDKIYYSSYYELKYCSVHDFTLRNHDSGRPRKPDCSRHYGLIAKERYCIKLLIDPPSC